MPAEFRHAKIVSKSGYDSIGIVTFTLLYWQGKHLLFYQSAYLIIFRFPLELIHYFAA
jgi:hypothetical protein